MRLLRKVVTKKSICCKYSTKPDRKVARSIYFSKCTDIFTNLALEDWLYKNLDFTNHHLLMLWRNEPCVVIGRHQNPWLECNFAELSNVEKGVRLARRNSGGGTVYHDMGNLNLTFFTSRAEYSRRRNLELISRALKNSFDLNTEINKREDLCIEDYKISGTASKLGRTSAYHHCTLLINANKEHISLALKNILGPNVKTNASISVRSKIMNLEEALPSITVEQVMEAIIKEYRENIDSNAMYFETDNPLPGVRIIESIDDDNFHGVNEIKKIFLSDEWRFGRTPKFTIYRDIFFDSVSGADGTEDTNRTINAFLVIEKGSVSDVGIKCKDIHFSMNRDNLGNLKALFELLIGKPFSKAILDEFEMIICALKNSEQCMDIIVDR